LRLLLLSDRDEDLHAAEAAAPGGVSRVADADACRKALAAGGYDVWLADAALAAEARALEALGPVAGDVPLVLLADDPPPPGEADTRAVETLVRRELNPRLLERCLRHAAENAHLRRELDLARDRCDVLTRLSGQGLWEWDLVRNEATYSARWKALLGHAEAEIGSSPEEWLGRIHPNDAEKVRAEVRAVAEGTLERFESRHRLEGERVVRLVGTLTDVSGSPVSEAAARAAQFDLLTGLPNRHVLRDRIGRSLERARRRGDYLFGVLFIDLDHFKLVNDSLGPVAGDQLLVAIARRLEACMRATDTLSRLGGDEFALLLEDIRDVSDALRVAERVQEHLSQPFNLHGSEIFTSASIGITLSRKGYTGPDDLLRDADIALYRAKAQGRARHEIFDKDMHARAVERLELESGLRRAIERQEFVVHYQPIVDLATSEISAFEALVRWQHPERGLLPPGAFIPVAEETGLIIPIDRWVLGEACRQLQRWRERYPHADHLAVCVNLSRRQLTQEDLVDVIRRNLEATGLEAEHLHPEITESQIMENVEAATAVLDRLKELNIHLHMDDFGTGYSSLSHLIRFDIDILKIDGSFISNMDIRGENFEIVRMIISLAHNLGMKVIAEGVETAEQLALLKTLRCEYGQGYFFSRPVEAAAAEAFLAGPLPWAAR